MKKLFLLLPILFFFTSASLLANKTSVEVKAPSEIKKGVEVTIIINVFHKGNSNGHHTDWVSLKINGKEVKKWEYAKDNLPPNENFTLEFKYVVNEESVIEAAGHCNIHGSAGIKKATIKTN
jgi:desulfoferrodoxin (superoxide reductase-like protein)